ncbi:hypothetical protein TWF106_005403 [Orbilia oligospora]|uniref:Guanine nucleotide-binding protein subunit gamma n=1 Tax=Orbilia oligospora TaxID=2813651 RepID=A0A7C8UF83_ORBOL|nr:hypothetical protein TWF106_005403 [Orbilia oligospora]
MAVHNQAGAREPAREKKGSMQELKLRRLTELNARLREDLERPRVKVSEACSSMINYTKTTKDFMVPATWGQVSLSLSPTAKHKFHDSPFLTSRFSRNVTFPFATFGLTRHLAPAGWQRGGPVYPAK